jgi:hypothetical protein
VPIAIKRRVEKKKLSVYEELKFTYTLRAIYGKTENIRKGAAWRLALLERQQKLSKE